MVRFNTDPLVVPISREEMHSLKRRRASGEFGTRTFPIGVVVVTVVILSFGSILATFVNTMLAMGAPGPFGQLPWFFMIIFIVFCAALIYIYVRSFTNKQWAFLARFADANGLRFSMASPSPRYPGLIFDNGRDRKSVHHMYSPTGTLADVGSYQYTTGSGKNRHVHTWHFAAFRLPRRVPHLLLDAKVNNKKMWGIEATNLPDSFESSQRLTLGAPFDNHYELYAPSGYGQDAFYLLPPNVMEALLNAPAVYDIELVDNWLFCYTQSSQDLTNPATWRLFETITNGILGSLEPVVGRYRDRRMEQPPAAVAAWRPQPATHVAPQGIRLRKGFNKSSLIIIVFGIGYLLLQLLLHLFIR